MTKLSDEVLRAMHRAWSASNPKRVTPEEATLIDMQAAWDASPGPELVSALKACREDYPDSSFRRYLDGLLSNLGAPHV